MREAQRHLQVGLRFLVAFCRNESPSSVIESLGPAIFLFILALLRSGQHTVIRNILDRIAPRDIKTDTSHQAVPDSTREPTGAYT